MVQGLYGSYRITYFRSNWLLVFAHCWPIFLVQEYLKLAEPSAQALGKNPLTRAGFRVQGFVKGGRRES